MTASECTDNPRMSVLIGMPRDNSKAVAAVIRSFSVQSIAHSIEVVVMVAPGAKEFVPTAEMSALAAVRVVQAQDFETFPACVVQGVDHARAEIVVLFEDHAFAGPGWAQSLLDAHAKGYAAVCTAMDNANPRTGRSWAHILNDLGQFLHGEPPGEKADLPAHNTSYRRDVLTAYSRGELSHLLSLYALNKDLRRRGHRLYLTDDAVCLHQNPSKWIPSILLRFRVHRLRAGNRALADEWSMARRMIYVALTPLIPFARMADVVLNSRRQKRRELFRPRVAAAVMFFAFINALGELFGLLIGPGSTDVIGRIEFGRHRQMCASDLLPEPTLEITQSPARTR